MRLLAHPAPVHADLSVDGCRLTVTTASVQPGSGTVDLRLRVHSLLDGSTEEIPTARYATWAPWGRRLAWISADEGGTTGLTVREHDGSVSAIAGTERVAAAPAWSPDGALIAFVAPTCDGADRTRPLRWSRPYPAQDGTGPLDAPPQVHVVAPDGSQLRQLTDDGWRWNALAWSPDAVRIAACAGVDPQGRRGGQRLHLLGTDGTIETPDLPMGRSITVAWLDSDRFAALLFEPSDTGPGSAPALFLVDGADVRRVEVTGLDGELGGDVYGDHPAELCDLTDRALLAYDDDSLIVRTVRAGAFGIARLQLRSGELEQLVAPTGSCRSPVGFFNGRLVFTHVAPDAPASIRCRELRSGNEATLTAVPGDLVVPSTIERFEVTTDAPSPIRAWLLRPAEAIGPLPTALVIHGGPHYAYGESFSLDAQALLESGFAVLYANPRGSTGQGTTFATAVHGDWAAGPTRDLLAVIDEAVARGWVDPTRLGVSGNSYGGYLSTWLAATTDRFKAAVVENPVTDPASMYGASDIGPWFFSEQFGGAPWEVPGRYREQSPLWRADACTTPLLFVVCADDRRCPPVQAWSMHRLVSAAGTPSEVLVLPDASHEGSTYGPPRGRVAHDEALVDWFSRWL